MRYLFRFMIICLIVNFYLSVPIQATDVYLRGLKQAGRKITIAIPDFENESSLNDKENFSKKIAVILKNDLTMSGWFEVIDKKDS
ncbi:hypothetical protein KAI68_06845, partial [bacterium]|nr:hypothetical protein [bacterium]